MNPSQKAGNSRNRRRHTKMRKGDYRTKKIAKQEVKKALTKKIESKVTDVYNTAINVDYSGVFTALTGGLTRGTGENQFIGDTIQPSHVRIRWAIVGVDSWQVIRVIVIQNKAGGVPVAGTLLQQGSSVITPLSPYNTSYKDTYRVLYDEFYTMVSAPGASATNTSQISGDIRIPAKKLRKITFDGVGNVTSGDIYFVMFSDSSVITPPVAQFYARLFYKDA